MPQIAWSRASAEDCDRYRNCLSQALRSVIVPNEAITCGSVNCSDENHIRAINVYADHVTEACIAAAESTMPHTCSRREN